MLNPVTIKTFSMSTQTRKTDNEKDFIYLVEITGAWVNLGHPPPHIALIYIENISNIC